MSEIDFYTLLGITFETSQKDIDRAWRRTALKYHPDKVGNDPVAKEKFHMAQVGYDLLSDPAIKVLYDSTRSARLQRERKNDLLKGRRRTMADDLLARERGVKRGRAAGEDEEEKLEREIRRLAEDGKRRRNEREATLKKDMERKAEQTSSASSDPQSPPIQHGVSEIDRTIKIRWPHTSTPDPPSPSTIRLQFSKFGAIESADLLGPKALKPAKKKAPRQLMATCMVQYASVVGAHAAVTDFPTQTGPEWQRFDSVAWAAGKEPAFIIGAQQPAQPPTGSTTPLRPLRDPSSPSAFFLQHPDPSTTTTTTTTTTPRDAPLRQKPSFASFSSAAAAALRPSPGGSFAGPEGPEGSPSLEERILIRLKNAERMRVGGGGIVGEMRGEGGSEGESLD